MKHNNTNSHMITALIFFAFGFLAAATIYFGTSGATISISKAVQGTITALTPSPEPTATFVPVHLTYDESDYRLGDPNAPIKMVEFSDYRCPFCGYFATGTLYPLLDKYEGYVEYIYRDYPVFGSQSFLAAQGAYCANEQDKFWEFHNSLFSSQIQATPMPITETNLSQTASTLEIATDEFAVCMADESILDNLIAKYTNAYELLQDGRTPIFLINGQQIVGTGSLEFFTQIIDQKLIQMGIEPPAQG